MVMASYAVSQEGKKWSMHICVFVGVKGGALVSVLYDYSLHGDPAMTSLLLHILSHVSCKIKGLGLRRS